jgi:hypothetical protein
VLHFVPSIWLSSALRRRAAGVVDYSTIPSRVDEVVMRAALLIRLPLSLLRHTYRHYSVAASEREMAAHAASGPSDQPREAPVVEAVLGRDDLAKAFRDVLRSSISTGLNTEVGVYNHSLWLGATSDDRIDENVLMNDLMQVCVCERARATMCVRELVRELASPCGAGGSGGNVLSGAHRSGSQSSRSSCARSTRARRSPGPTWRRPKLGGALAAHCSCYPSLALPPCTHAPV